MDKYQQTIDTFNNVAEAYWEKFKNFEPYLPTYDWFLQQLPKGQIDLLEIACGPGNVSRYLLKKNSHINLFGTDVAPNMIALAEKYNPQAEFKLVDCREIMTLERAFDAIMCGFCLPYISWNDSQNLINDMASMLRPNGLLYLSTTKGSKSDQGYQGSNSSHGSIYVHYHDISEIIACLKQHRFKIVGQKTITHIHNNAEINDVFIIAQMNA